MRHGSPPDEPSVPRAGGARSGLFGLLVAAAGAGAWGAEGGSTEYVGGFTGFAAGYLPADPGTYFTSEFYYYDGSVSKLVANGRIAVNISTATYFENLALTQLTRYTFLGGNYGFGLEVPVGYFGGEATIQPLGFERSAHAFGLGDLALVPLLLGWRSRDWSANFALSIIAPTGEYDESQPVSLSKHFWALDGAYSGSYLTEHGFDLSFSLGYTVNRENPDTHYRSGDVTHLDLAVGQYLNPVFKVGLVGYAVVQVTGDSGSGAILGPFKSNIYAAGAALEFDPKMGGRDVSWQLRWYREFDARNHLAGNAVYLTTDLKL
jgi:hypothetical protein